MRHGRLAGIAAVVLVLAACDSGPVTIRAASSSGDDVLNDSTGSTNGTVTIPSDGTYMYTYGISDCSADYSLHEVSTRHLGDALAAVRSARSCRATTLLGP